LGLKRQDTEPARQTARQLGAASRSSHTVGYVGYRTVPVRYYFLYRLSCTLRLVSSDVTEA
jgi:hypothetical protein